MANRKRNIEVRFRVTQDELELIPSPRRMPTPELSSPCGT